MDAASLGAAAERAVCAGDLISLEAVEAGGVHVVDAVYLSCRERFAQQTDVLYEVEGLVFSQDAGSAGREFTEGCVFRIVQDSPSSAIRYGDDVQLQHVRSKRFLAWKHTLATRNLRSLRVTLQQVAGPESFFRILPAFLYRSEGDRVMAGDSIVLAASESGGGGEQFLHVEPRTDNALSVEVNVFERESFWRPKIFRSFRTSELASVVKGGDIVRLIHRQNGFPLSLRRAAGSEPRAANAAAAAAPAAAAAGSAAPAGRATNSRLHPYLFSGKSGFSSRGDSWSLWVVEREQAVDGEGVCYEQTIRLKNISAGEYLCVTTDGRGLETSQRASDQTRFVFESSLLNTATRGNVGGGGGSGAAGAGAGAPGAPVGGAASEGGASEPHALLRRKSSAALLEPAHIRQGSLQRTPSLAQSIMDAGNVGSAAVAVAAGGGESGRVRQVVHHSARVRLRSVTTNKWVRTDASSGAPSASLPAQPPIAAGAGRVAAQVPPATLGDAAASATRAFRHHRARNTGEVRDVGLGPRNELDAFEIQLVSPTEAESFYSVWSRKPAIEEVLRAVEGGAGTQMRRDALDTFKSVLDSLGKQCTAVDSFDVQVRDSHEALICEALLMEQELVHLVVHLTQRLFCVYEDLSSAQEAAQRSGAATHAAAPSPSPTLAAGDSTPRDGKNRRRRSSGSVAAKLDDLDASVPLTLGLVRRLLKQCYKFLRFFVHGSERAQSYVAAIDVPVPRQAAVAAAAAAFAAAVASKRAGRGDMRDVEADAGERREVFFNHLWRHFAIHGHAAAEAMLLVQRIAQGNSHMLAQISEAHIVASFGVPSRMRHRVADFLSVFCTHAQRRGIRRSQDLVMRYILDVQTHRRLITGGFVPSAVNPVQPAELASLLEVREPPYSQDLRLLPKLKLGRYKGGPVQVLWDAKLDDQYAPLEGSYSTSQVSGLETRRSSTALRTSLWLAQALSQSNEPLADFYRRLLPAPLLLSIARSSTLPFNLRRNCVELLSTLYVDSPAAAIAASLRSSVRFDPPPGAWSSQGVAVMGDARRGTKGGGESTPLSEADDEPDGNGDDDGEDEEHVEAVQPPWPPKDSRAAEAKVPEGDGEVKEAEGEAESSPLEEELVEFVLEQLKAPGLLTMSAAILDIERGAGAREHWRVVFAVSLLQLVDRMVRFGWLSLAETRGAVRSLGAMVAHQAAHMPRYLHELPTRDRFLARAEMWVCSILQHAAHYMLCYYVDRFLADVAGCTVSQVNFGARDLCGRIRKAARESMASISAAGAPSRGHGPAERRAAGLRVLRELRQDFALRKRGAVPAPGDDETDARAVFSQQMQRSLLSLLMHVDKSLQNRVLELIVFLHGVQGEWLRLLRGVMLISRRMKALANPLFADDETPAGRAASVSAELQLPLPPLAEDSAAEAKAAQRAAEEGDDEEAPKDEAPAGGGVVVVHLPGKGHHAEDDEAQRPGPLDASSLLAFFQRLGEAAQELEGAVGEFRLGLREWDRVNGALAAAERLLLAVEKGTLPRVQMLSASLSLHTLLFRLLVRLPPPAAASVPIALLAARSGSERQTLRPESPLQQAPELKREQSPPAAPQGAQGPRMNRLGSIDPVDLEFAAPEDAARDDSHALSVELSAELRIEVLEHALRILRNLASDNHDVQLLMSSVENIDLLTTELRLAEDAPATAGLLLDLLLMLVRSGPDVCHLFVERHLVVIATHFWASRDFRCLDLLSTLVLPSPVSLPSRVNQTAVFELMFGEQREAAAAAYVSRLSCERVRGMQAEERRIVLGLVQLMAVCAQGRNRMVEVKCQSLLSLKSVLQLLWAPGGTPLTFNERTVFVHFMHEVYVHTAPESTFVFNDFPAFVTVVAHIRRDFEEVMSLAEHRLPEGTLRVPPAATRHDTQRRDPAERLLGGEHAERVEYVLDRLLPLLSDLYLIFSQLLQRNAATTQTGDSAAAGDGLELFDDGEVQGDEGSQHAARSDLRGNGADELDDNPVFGEGSTLGRNGGGSGGAGGARAVGLDGGRAAPTNMSRINDELRREAESVTRSAFRQLDRLASTKMEPLWDVHQKRRPLQEREFYARNRRENLLDCVSQVLACYKPRDIGLADEHVTVLRNELRRKNYSLQLSVHSLRRQPQTNLVSQLRLGGDVARLLRKMESASRGETLGPFPRIFDRGVSVKALRALASARQGAAGATQVASNLCLDWCAPQSRPAQDSGAPLHVQDPGDQGSRTDESEALGFSGPRMPHGSVSALAPAANVEMVAVVRAARREGPEDDDEYVSETESEDDDEGGDEKGDDAKLLVPSHPPLHAPAEIARRGSAKLRKAQGTPGGLALPEGEAARRGSRSKLQLPAQGEGSGEPRKSVAATSGGLPSGGVGGGGRKNIAGASKAADKDAGRSGDGGNSGNGDLAGVDDEDEDNDEDDDEEADDDLIESLRVVVAEGGESVRSVELFERLCQYLAHGWRSRLFRSHPDDVTRVALLTAMINFVQDRLDTCKSEEAQMWQRSLGKSAVPLVMRLIVAAPEDRADIVARALHLGALLLEGGNEDIQARFYAQLQDQQGRDVLRQLRRRLRHFKEEVRLRHEETVNWELHHDRSELDLIAHLLVFLQLLCEGHNEQMQNFLRSQPNWEYPIDLISEVTDLTVMYAEGLISSILNDDTFIVPEGLRMAELMMRALTEFVQGPCRPNQLLLATFRSVVATCNRILAAVAHRLRLESPATTNDKSRRYGEEPSKGKGSETRDDEPVERDKLHLCKQCVMCGADVVVTFSREVSSRVDERKLPSRVCGNMHAVCAAHTAEELSSHECTFCCLLRLEKCVLEFWMGLVEGNSEFRVPRALLYHLQVKDLFRLLRLHSRPENWNAQEWGECAVRRQLALHDHGRYHRPSHAAGRRDSQRAMSDLQSSGDDALRSSSFFRTTLTLNDERSDLPDAGAGGLWRRKGGPGDPAHSATEHHYHSSRFRSIDLHVQNTIRVVSLVSSLVHRSDVESRLVSSEMRRRNGGRELRALRDARRAFGKWAQLHGELARELVAVEIRNRDGNLERLFFRKPRIFVDDATWIEPIQRAVIEECSLERGTHDRLSKFLVESERVEEAFEREYDLRHSGYCRWLVNLARSSQWWLVAFCAALAINVVLLVESEQADVTPIVDDIRDGSGGVEFSGRVRFSNEDVVLPLTRAFGAVHLVAAVLMISSYFITVGFMDLKERAHRALAASDNPLIFSPKAWITGSASVGGDASALGGEVSSAVVNVSRGDRNSDEDSKKKKKRKSFGDLYHLLGPFRLAWVILSSDRVVYYALYLAASVLGLAISPFFNAFHLVDIVLHVRTIHYVVLAATSRSGQILATLLLGLVAIFVYTVVCFTLFQGRLGAYNFGPDNDGAFDCQSLFRCFETHLDLGFKSSPLWGRDDRVPGLSTFYDFSYFFLVNVILVSVITGVVIDAFGELRGERERIESDLQSNCVVCGIDREAFDLHGNGFVRHIVSEHNVWGYVMLRRYLRRKKAIEETEFTGLETYVSDRLSRYSTEVFPVSMALSLNGKLPNGGTTPA